MWIILLSGYMYNMYMGRIDINLPDDLENKLRMEVGRRMGAKRGALTLEFRNSKYEHVIHGTTL